MTQLLSVVVMFILGMTSLNLAISDVPKSDSAYPAIQRTVSTGYMTQYGDNFRPNEPVTRKELAIAIDRMVSLLDKGPSNLNDAEKQELGHLSKTYKQYLSGLELTVNGHSSRLSKAEEFQDALRFDLSKTQSDMQDEIDQLKAENKKQHKFMVIGIIAAAIIGLLG
jgi:hypothetical protein